MSESNSTSSSGIGFCGMLTIVFIILKLCKVIAWSWVWVLSPLDQRGPVAVLLGALCLDWDCRSLLRKQAIGFPFRLHPTGKL